MNYENSNATLDSIDWDELPAGAPMMRVHDLYDQLRVQNLQHQQLESIINFERKRELEQRMEEQARARLARRMAAMNPRPFKPIQLSRQLPFCGTVMEFRGLEAQLVGKRECEQKPPIRSHARPERKAIAVQQLAANNKSRPVSAGARPFSVWQATKDIQDVPLSRAVSARVTPAGSAKQMQFARAQSAGVFMTEQAPQRRAQSARGQRPTSSQRIQSAQSYHARTAPGLELGANASLTILSFGEPQDYEQIMP